MPPAGPCYTEISYLRQKQVFVIGQVVLPGSPAELEESFVFAFAHAIGRYYISAILVIYRKMIDWQTIFELPAFPSKSLRLFYCHFPMAWTTPVPGSTSNVNDYLSCSF